MNEWIQVVNSIYLFSEKWFQESKKINYLQLKSINSLHEGFLKINLISKLAL